MKKGKIGESYNIGSGDVAKNIDLIKRIMKIFKNNFSKNKHISKIKFVLDRPDHDLGYALNSNKISNFDLIIFDRVLCCLTESKIKNPST